ncbi:hypothetical protein ABE426_06510 [Sphingobacterium faecium]|uniref:hypothetical protein n=1 Tax=Sphingobacterium faecium TaxID=34087 RepID=UPI003209A7D4
MINYIDNRYLFDELFSELSIWPNTHLVKKRLLNFSNVPAYFGFVCEDSKGGTINSFINVNNKEIKKLALTCSLSFYDEDGIHYENKLLNFTIDLFVVLKNPNLIEDHIIMGIDEFIFYLNTQRNEEAKKQFDLPSLNPCQLPSKDFNYISEGRRIKNLYFESYNGPVLDIYFEDELKEVFAIARNSLAFLYRHKSRVFEEIELIGNHNYHSQFSIYPRFNNCISETAQGLYNFWERIAFVFNEFFPLRNNTSNAPSYYKYFTEQSKKNDNSFKTINFQWFFNRLENEHDKLSNMRHPTIHFSSSSTPSGMRSIDLIKHSHDDLDKTKLMKTWDDEISFLKSELTKLSEALEKTLFLIEEWAIAKSNLKEKL